MHGPMHTRTIPGSAICIYMHLHTRAVCECFSLVAVLLRDSPSPILDSGMFCDATYSLREARLCCPCSISLLAQDIFERAGIHFVRILLDCTPPRRVCTVKQRMKYNMMCCRNSALHVLFPRQSLLNLPLFSATGMFPCSRSAVST